MRPGEIVRPGTRVQVRDEGLMALNKIMGYTEEEAPNNKGTVAEEQDLYADSGMVLINFDDGQAAPYPIEQVAIIDAALHLDDE